MDMTSTIEPRSDQLNADDLMTGPRTFTITDVTAGTAEQPVDVHLAEYPERPWKPSKSMRRVLVAAWGPDTTAYVGRRVTLYRDPSIRFGKDEVGGIRVSHLSHLPKPLRLALTVKRGQRAPFTVEPLPNVAPSTLTRMPEETTDRIEALMAQLGLDEATEKAVTSWATGKRTDDWTALTAEESARLIGALEKKAAEQ